MITKVTTQDTPKPVSKELCHRLYRNLKLLTNTIRQSTATSQFNRYHLKLGYEPINWALDFGRNGARKQDPSLFPSLKYIDNWPTFKRETMAQNFAQDVVNIFNPKYKPWGSEEKDLFTLQLYNVYAIFCSNLKTDFG
jgi:hypothetical protein